MPKRLTIPNAQDSGSAEDPPEQHVTADAIGATYNVTGRYVLKLASENRIPCLRIGKKCVRFSPAAVAKALGIEIG